MKILYAIQGTGNGHISRARDIVPILQLKGEVDILVSGTQADLELPYTVKYKLNGLSFIFGKKGGIDLVRTFQKSRLRNLLKEINKFPIDQYDIVISDFEPVSSWACFLKNKACFALSHQAAVLTKDAPQPKKTDLIGRSILKRYAPSTIQFGFHFESYNETTFTPVIRNEVRMMKPSDQGHFTVYLPSYSEKRLLKVLSKFKDVKWEVFSKHSKKPLQAGNVFIYPINNEAFLNSMASAQGVLCGAGFETPAEALFLNKKLLVIPMKGQYEQQCNAAALKRMGVPVIKSLKLKHAEQIHSWIDSNDTITVSYPDRTAEIIDMIFERHHQGIIPDLEMANTLPNINGISVPVPLKQFAG